MPTLLDLALRGIVLKLTSQRLHRGVSLLDGVPREEVGDHPQILLSSRCIDRPCYALRSLTCVRSFEQKDVLRVVKALASFRPSLIALQWVTWGWPRHACV